MVRKRSGRDRENNGPSFIGHGARMGMKRRAEPAGGALSAAAAGKEEDDREREAEKRKS